MTTEVNKSDEDDNLFLDNPVNIEDTAEYNDEDQLDYDDDTDSDGENADEFDEVDAAHIGNICRSLRDSRNDSWKSFMTRSERNSLLGKDKPPPVEESMKRSVKFPEEAELAVVHEISPIDPNLKQYFWVQRQDFERFDTDTKMTLFRWENHVSGKIVFDETKNTVRGLEEIFLIASEKKKIPIPYAKVRPPGYSKMQHVRNVLREINRQKLDEGATNLTLDLEKIRQASLICSEHSFKMAIELGANDEIAKKIAWGELPAEHLPLVKPHQIPRKDSSKTFKGFKNPLKAFFSKS